MDQTWRRIYHFCSYSTDENTEKERMLGRQLCAQEEEGNGIVGAAGSHQHQPCGVDLGAHTDGLAPPYVRTSQGWVAHRALED